MHVWIGDKPLLFDRLFTLRARGTNSGPWSSQGGTVMAPPEGEPGAQPQPIGDFGVSDQPYDDAAAVAALRNAAGPMLRTLEKLRDDLRALAQGLLAPTAKAMVELALRDVERLDASDVDVTGVG